ncbi:MAG TPA: hypothetical protein VKW09_07995 [bacterium]|nr:hypothetical protein [bacterium]
MLRKAPTRVARLRRSALRGVRLIRSKKRAARLTRLPKRSYVIREKYLRRFRTLARQLTDIPLSPDTTFDGLLNMGEDGNEIWVEAGLPAPEKQFTILHELVHARRQRAGEDLDDDVLEEQIVELEAVARASRRLLNRMSSGMVLSLIHNYLTRRDADDPNTTAGLTRVYTRIGQLLSGRTSPRRVAPVPQVAHRRPSTRRRPTH